MLIINAWLIIDVISNVTEMLNNNKFNVFDIYGTCLLLGCYQEVFSVLYFFFVFIGGMISICIIYEYLYKLSVGF